MAWRSPRERGRRTRRLPVSDDIDRINEIANGLAAASLALQAGDDDLAQQAVNDTLAKTSTYLSAAVSETQRRSRRQRRVSWTAGTAVAALAGAGVFAIAPSAPPGHGGDPSWPQAAGMWAGGPVLAIVSPDPADVGLPGLPDDAKLARQAVAREPADPSAASLLIESIPSEPTTPAVLNAEPQSTHPSDGRSERAEKSGNAKPGGSKNEAGGPKNGPGGGKA